MPVRKEFRKDRSKGFRAFFSSVPTSNDAHLKLELYDDNEPKEDTQFIEAWRHCGQDDLLYFCVTPWKSEGGLVLDAANARLIGDMLLAYADVKEKEDEEK